MTAALRIDPDNPFATVSRLPYGLPDFSRIRLEHIAPAVRAGIAQEAAEVEAVAAQTSPATPENVLDALERTGALLDRALVVLAVLLDADSSPELDDLEDELNPEISAHEDAMAMHAGLQARFRALAERADSGAVVLDGAQRRLLDEHVRDFRRSGGGLGPERQAELRRVNARITDLEASFARTVLAASTAAAVRVTDRGRLAGLSDDEIASARSAAQAAGQEGFVLELSSPTQQEVQARLEDRALREEVHRASTTRGSGGGADTRGTLVELVRLRARRSGLLGYRDHASYVAEVSTAGSPARVREVLAPLVPGAVANAAREIADMQAVLDAGGGSEGEPLAPWDVAWAGERLRSVRFHVDDAVLRPYLELDRVLEHGVFAAANLLYGVSFVERADLRGYHEDVRVWEVRGADGSGLGLFLGDYLARPGKRGGAWSTSLVDQSHLTGELPVVINVLNVARPAPGRPVLLTWDDVVTAFHELGHALHALLSDVRYPSQSGTAVPGDVVEFPSQVNEMWAWHAGLLRDFAVHHVTGESLPPEQVEQLRRSQRHGQGVATTEMLAATFLDLAWHSVTEDELDDLLPDGAAGVERFERRALGALGLDVLNVPPRYRSTYFTHVFGGGYDAAYYAYLWSEVLDADAVVWFEESGGLRRESGERFRREVLAVGGSTDPMAAFERLRGRPASTAPLLARRGLDAGTV